jgi:hypothetical protein
MTADDLSSRLARALALVDEAITEAAARLEAQPDNPAITRHTPAGSKLTAFTINLSDIAKAGGRSTGSWDPFSHDWLAQYRYARDLIVARRFTALRDLLAGLGYRDPSLGYRSLAPEVVERIRAITGDIRFAVEVTDLRGLRSHALVGSAAAPERRAPRMR